MTACIVLGLLLVAIGIAMCNETRGAYPYRRSIAQYPLWGVIAGLFLWLGLVFLGIAAVVAICARHPFC